MHLVILACLLLARTAASKELVALEPDQAIGRWESDGWTKLGRVEGNALVHLTFALKNRNTDVLEKKLLDISNPKSENYGNYMSMDAIADLVSPSRYTRKVVFNWLNENGIDIKECDFNFNKDFLACLVPCAVAEKLLIGTTFHYFKHAKLPKSAVRSTSTYYVPTHVSKHLDFVGGVHRFPAVNWGRTDNEELRSKEAQDVKGLHVGVYPKVIRERYGLGVDDVGSHPNNSQAVASFLEQYYHVADLTEFFYLFVGSSEFPHLADISHVVGPDTGRSGIEASLDTQYILSIGANISTWFWSTAGRHGTEEPFLTWLIAIGNTSSVPWVHSVSYGEAESSLSVSYMQRVSVEFMKTGLRGISLLFASGDDGAGCSDDEAEVFVPAFPGSSPYVTTVGGTGFHNPFSIGEEKGVDFSGGGFSNVFPRPAYQNASVLKYFEIGQKIPAAKYFNASGRAYPDISALARHYWVVNNHVPVPGVMGTSASTPVTAGIISLLNEHRLANSAPPMGFLNPFLYEHAAQALHDVTSGYNEGCLPHDTGFYAGEQWDPVTGNGSPIFPPLLEAAMKVVRGRQPK